MKEIARRTGGEYAIDSSNRPQSEPQTIESQMNRIISRQKKRRQREADPEGSRVASRRSKTRQREAKRSRSAPPIMARTIEDTD